MRADRSKQSGAAVVKSQANKVLKKAVQGGIALEDTFMEKLLPPSTMLASGFQSAPWKWRKWSQDREHEDCRYILAANGP